MDTEYYILISIAVLCVGVMVLLVVTGGSFIKKDKDE